jgi:hypothetical protein
VPESSELKEENEPIHLLYFNVLSIGISGCGIQSPHGEKNGAPVRRPTEASVSQPYWRSFRTDC